jgi:hypothetical protein
MPECYVIHTLLVFLHRVVMTSTKTYMNMCVYIEIVLMCLIQILMKKGE